MAYVIGVDGGGSKTACVVVDERLRVLGQATTGSSHAPAGEIQDSVATLCSAMNAALTQAQISQSDVDIAYIGLSQVDIDRHLSEPQLGLLREALPVRHVCVDSDACVALVGALGRPDGIVVVSGTGSIAVGADKHGKRVRAGGWGYLVGDEGSGLDISIRAIKAAVRCVDRRDVQTLLVQYVKDYFRIEDLSLLRSLLYRGVVDRSRIAGFVPSVVKAADMGDEVARAIFDHAARELALCACAVAAQLGITGTERTNVALVGGVLRAARHILEPLFARELVERVPQATVKPPLFEPVLGAAILGLWELGLRPVLGCEV